MMVPERNLLECDSHRSSRKHSDLLINALSMVIIIAAAFIITLPASLAENRTSVLAKEFMTGESFVLNNDAYTVRVDNYERVILEYSSDFMLIMNNSCENRGTYDFCVKDIVFDLDKDEKKAKFEVFFFGPDIKTTLATNNSDFDIGEETTITVTLKNDGGQKATNVTFMYLFPNEFSFTKIVTKSEGIQNKTLASKGREGEVLNGMFWNGEIKVGETKTFRFNERAVKPIKASYYPTLIYDNGKEVVTKPPTSLSFSTTDYYSIKTLLAPIDYKTDPGQDITEGEAVGSVKNGEEFLFIVHVHNRDDTNHTINVSRLDMYFPDGIRYISNAFIRVHENASTPNSSYFAGREIASQAGKGLYRWSGKVWREDKVLVMRLRGIAEGTHSVQVIANIDREDNHNIMTFASRRDLEVQMEEAEIKSNLDDGELFLSGQQAKLNLYMDNPNEFINFTDVNVSMSIPWVPDTFKNIPLIKKGAIGDIIDTFVTLPSVSERISQEMTVNATYSTEYGSIYSKRFTQTVTVEPVSALELIHYIGNEVIQKGGGNAEIDNKKTVVTVTATNIGGDNILSALITDVVNASLLKDNVMTRRIDVRKGETVNVFTYEIIPPGLVTNQTFGIISNASFMYANASYATKKVSEITVLPKKIDLTISKKVEEDEISRGQQIHLTYELENKEKEPIFNVVIEFPYQRFFDLTGQTTAAIPTIPAEGRIVLNRIETVRPKVNVSALTFSPSRTVFYDQYGNKHSALSNAPTITVKSGPLYAPSFSAEKNSSRSAKPGESITVTTLVTNLGDKAGNASLKDNEKEISFMLGVGDTKKITYDLIMPAKGILRVPQTIIKTTFDGITYYSGSNEYNITPMIEQAAPVTAPEPIIEAKDDSEKVTFEEFVSKARFNIKYLYLFGFIVLICLVLFFLLGSKPKDQEFDFLNNPEK